MIAEVAVFCWHVHHFVQVEPLWEPIEERIDYIKKHKPASERKLRLRLLRPVQGQLPPELVQAGKAYAQAGAAYVQAWVEYLLILAMHKEEIDALHALECPNCPWDGKTIFS